MSGTFHFVRPGWPSSVLTSDQVWPSSLLSNTPAASAPTRTRPCAAAMPESLDSFISAPGNSRPSLDSVQVSPRSLLRQTAAPCHSLAADA